MKAGTILKKFKHFVNLGNDICDGVVIKDTIVAPLNLFAMPANRYGHLVEGNFGPHIQGFLCITIPANSQRDLS